MKRPKEPSDEAKEVTSEFTFLIFHSVNYYIFNYNLSLYFLSFSCHVCCFLLNNSKKKIQNSSKKRKDISKKGRQIIKIKRIKIFL